MTTRWIPAALFLLAAPAVRAADGQALWKAKCKACHGVDGKADTREGRKEKIEDLSTAEWQRAWSDENIRKVILEGSKENKKMKPFRGKLSEEELDALVKVIRSFQG